MWMVVELSERHTETQDGPRTLHQMVLVDSVTEEEAVLPLDPQSYNRLRRPQVTFDSVSALDQGYDAQEVSAPARSSKPANVPFSLLHDSDLDHAAD